MRLKSAGAKDFNNESMHPDEVAYRPVQQCLV